MLGPTDHSWASELSLRAIGSYGKVESKAVTRSNL